MSFARPLKTWTKGHNSPVSEADIAVDELLRRRLREAAPQFGWLSEESPDDPARLTMRRLWIVDPIDGTRAFIGGGADWSISAALVEDGRPTLAAILAPASDEMFAAVTGEGATCNGHAIHATQGDALADARIGGPQRRIERLAVLEPRICAMPKCRSLALRLAQVASGALDSALVGPNSRDWDLAGADLIVHESGGTLTTMSGKALVYNRPDPIHGALVAAGRARHRALIALLGGHREFC